MRASIACLALCLLTVAAMAAPPNKLVGTWKLAAVTTASGPVPKEKLEEGEMTWSFSADGKFAASVTQGNETRSSKGSWQVNGKQLQVTDGEHKQDMDYTVSASALTVSNAAAKLTMEFRRTR